MFITLNRVEKSITGSYLDVDKNVTVNFGVTYSEEKWKQMVELQAKSNDISSKEELKSIIEEFAKLAADDLKTKVETICPNLYVQESTRKFYLKISGRLINNPIPQGIADRLIKSVEVGMSPDPIIKACIRFMRNPNFSQDKFEKLAWYINQTTVLESLKKEFLDKGFSEEAAQEKATVFQTAITMEGLLCTFKVSREIEHKFVKNADGSTKKVTRFIEEFDEDTGTITYKKPEFAEDRLFEPAVKGQSGDAFECTDIITGVSRLGHFIRVGHVHTLPDWKMVDCNDNHSCVPGLHVGNLDYIRGYQSSGTVTHEVFVDPMDIGAIVQDGTGAIRVRRYFVHRSYVGPNRSLYLSSHYAKITNDEWLKMKEEILASRDTVSVEQAEVTKDILAI